MLVTVLIAGLFFVSGVSVMGQFDTTLIKNAFNSSERLYVASDRQVYVTGDTLRYNVLLRGADMLEKAQGSSIVYFDLSGPRESDFVQWRLNIKDGNGSGALVVPAGLTTGIYRLRAYTRWMRNGSSGYFFQSSMMIINVTDEEVAGISVENEGADRRAVEFYPEGGSIVREVLNHVGYRLNGVIRPDSIIITHNDSLTGERIFPDKTGVGAFSFLPENDRDYFALLFFPGGVYQKHALPRMTSYGEVVHVEDTPVGTLVKVISKPERAGETKLLHMTVLCRGIIIKDTVFYSSGTGEVFIEKTRQGEGLIYIAIHDSKKFLLAERLYYVEPDIAPLNLPVDIRDSYGRGENVKFTISMDEQGVYDAAVFSVSVSQSHPFENVLLPTGIQSSMLLQQEIENFNTANIEIAETGKIQDFLLCTDIGDYAWNYSGKMQAGDCEFEKETEGAVIKGRLLDLNTRLPLKDVKVFLGVADSIYPSLLFTKTDEAGTFEFIADLRYDNRDIILQTLEEDNASLIWDMEKSELYYTRQDTVIHYLTPTEKEFITDTRNIYLTERIYGGNAAESPQIKSTENLNYFVEPDMVVYPSDFTELVNFREINDNILPGVRFNTRNRQYSTSFFNRATGLWLENNNVLLNGVLFKDLAYIATLGTGDVKRLDVFNSNIFMGDVTFNGFLSIYTYDGIIPANYVKSQTMTYTNKTGKESSAIIAAGRDKVMKPFPDFSRTLYWAPGIRLKTGESLPVEFTTSQLKGDYLINIEGITGDGTIISKQIKFSVK